MAIQVNLKIFRRVFFPLLMLLVAGLHDLYAQLPMDTLLRKYHQQHLQEKLYLHSDKNFYVAGETIWFRIYNVDASLHLPLWLSKVAYVEMIDRNNQPVLQIKTSLQEGCGSGYLQLPLQLSSGNYKLRAYTNWMKNYGSDFFFEKLVTVINTRMPGLPSRADSLPKYDIGFFPEGGSLVNGIESKVAFKVSDPYGSGVIFSGAVIKENNDTLVKFAPLKCGIGNFLFTPQKNETYRTVIRIPGEKPIVSDFLKAEDYGYVMSVSNGPAHQVTINVRCNLPGPQLYLVAHTRQVVKAAMMSQVKAGIATFTIDRKQLGEGISHLTIFNAALEPVCERLYFRHPESLLNLHASTNKATYGTREKLILDISANASMPKQLSKLSVSVYLVDSLQKPDESDIASYLLLTSELKSYIASPLSYLHDQTKEGLEACDNLMLTHGWRRFAWKDVMAGRPAHFEFTPEYKGQIVKAKIVSADSAASPGTVTGYLSVPVHGFRFYTATNNDRGYLTFDVDDVKGNPEIILQTHPPTHLELENPFSNNYTTTRIAPLSITRAYEKNLTAHHIAVQVQQGYSRGEGFIVESDPTDTIPFYSSPDYSYNLDDYTRFITMEEVLREYVKFVFVRKRDNNYYLQMYDVHGSKPLENEPLVLLDGVPVFDGNQVLNIDPLKIRKLETVNSRYFLGPSIFEGIVSLTSYNPADESFVLNSNAVKINYEGLQARREFYSPRYDVQEKISSPIPDFRNVLQWSPELKITGNETLHESFYTSDRVGKYVVVIQGISSDGRCGSITTYFEVR